jgi:acylphosphatase
MIIAVTGAVRGRVQGVAYRASLRREAAVRGVVGWVRNRPDGSVQFFVQGDPTGVREILEWARIGPPFARVSGIATDAAEVDPVLAGFEIR